MVLSFKLLPNVEIMLKNSKHKGKKIKKRPLLVGVFDLLGS